VIVNIKDLFSRSSNAPRIEGGATRPKLNTSSPPQASDSAKMLNAYHLLPATWGEGGAEPAPNSGLHFPPGGWQQGTAFGDIGEGASSLGADRAPPAYTRGTSSAHLLLRGGASDTRSGGTQAPPEGSASKSHSRPLSEARQRAGRSHRQSGPSAPRPSHLNRRKAHRRTCGSSDA
jgi:hypothetical protein